MKIHGSSSSSGPKPHTAPVQAQPRDIQLRHLSVQPLGVSRCGAGWGGLEGFLLSYGTEKYSWFLKTTLADLSESIQGTPQRSDCLDSLNPSPL